MSPDGKGVEVQRYKGLGEMNPEQLWETTLNPEHRIFKTGDDRKLGRSRQYFLNADGRRSTATERFIEKNAVYANIDV